MVLSTRIRKWLPVAVAILGVALLMAPATARADFELMITTSSGFSMTLHDSSSGFISYTGAAGANFSITVDTALSYPVQGSPTNPDMDLNFLVHNATGVADTITISASDTDFGPLLTAGSFIMTTGGTIGNNASLTYQTFQDTTNHDFGATTSSPTLSFGPGPFSGISALPVNAASLYSLTQTVIVTTTGASTISADSELYAPAPAGVLLALSGMPVMGLGMYLRRRKAAIVA